MTTRKKWKRIDVRVTPPAEKIAAGAKISGDHWGLAWVCSE
jgi:hypothetical protein